MLATHAIALVATLLLVSSSLASQLVTVNSAADLDTLQCTANDVQITGTTLVNDPCGACPASGVFDAVVDFTISSQTAKRFCFSLYICDIPEPIQITLELARGSANYSYIFKDYPCGVSKCYGALPPGTTEGSVFPKGTYCPAGLCCSGFAYDVNPVADADCPLTEVVPSKCRFQQICIRAKTSSIECSGTCSATCANSFSADLQVCGKNMAYPLSFTIYSGKDTSGAVVKTITGVSADCTNASVLVTENNQFFTVKVTDKNGCTRLSTLSSGIPFTPKPTVSLSSFTAGCDGKGSYTANAVGGTPAYKYTFTIDGVAIANQPQTSNTFNYPVTLDSTCHSIGVSIEDANTCTASATPKRLNQCITSDETCGIA